MMKKAATVVFALFWAAMIFFTAFGDRLYYAFKPRVEVGEVISFDGGAYLPKSAVFEESDGDYHTLSCVTFSVGQIVFALYRLENRLGDYT